MLVLFKIAFFLTIVDFSFCQGTPKNQNPGSTCMMGLKAFGCVSLATLWRPFQAFLTLKLGFECLYFNLSKLFDLFTEHG